MKIWLRRGLVAVLVVAIALLGVVEYALFKARSRMDRRIDIAAYEVAVPTASAAVERGRYLFSTRDCVDCHGADGVDRAFIDDGSMRVRGANISPGPGNVVAKYTTADWERTLRHGVKSDGRPVMIMPSGTTTA